MFNIYFRNDQPQYNFLIESIKQATKKEEEYEYFYNYLITAAPTNEEAEIIRTIRDETRMHYKIFKQMYKDLTGLNIPSKLGSSISPESYLDSIKKAILLEIKAVDNYKVIRNAFPPMSSYNEILLNIIIDETNHTNKFNYIFSINTTMNKMR
ncbi:ferritin-like domain-containing protein [Clostridium sp. SHJSY1]|uniref:ferritin-like domain-containing protein n=1 Tax=Clostridium sp. SHJSY1 TaxID=2942483 RepID=UPI00287712D0|nr:ferritin-like domain-containing protein [Clostridium sp. SHJSY1]MDS0524633.1 ferritin-like domain-containing protein [Clostridium sp. SHJSY1]